MGENNFISDNNIFTLGGFDVTSNVSPSGNVSKAYQYGDIITLESISELTEQPVTLQTNTQNLEILDLSNPKEYLKYSSFSELIRASLETIIVSYPSSLYISSVIVGYSYGDVNAVNISYNQSANTTTFTLLTNYFNNPGGLSYISNLNSINTYKNLTVNFLNYYFEYENNSYEIIDIVPSNKIKNDKIIITVNGNPFNSGTINKKITAYIRPSEEYVKEYQLGLNYFERYLLRPYFTILDNIEESGGMEYEYKLRFSIPKIDKYNYDFSSDKYEKFLTELLKLATKYDEKHVNITSRKLIPNSFQDISITSGNFPTYGKANQLLNVFSVYFDSIYGNINALKYYDQISYADNSFDDKKNIIRIANTLGWNFDNNNVESFEKSELKAWVKNTPYLLNSKGTRKAILTALNYLNIPDELIEFNEKIYRATPINYDLLSYYYDVIDIPTLSEAPVNLDGTPDLSKNEHIFHSNDYFNVLKNLIPAIDDNFFSVISETQYSEILADIGFNLSGDTLDFSVYNLDWSNLACYSYTGGTINNPLPELFYDGCDCEISLDDLSLQICTTPLNPYDNYCPPLVVDVVPNCVALPQTGGTLSGDTACEFSLIFESEEGLNNVISPLVPTPVDYISFPYVIKSLSCNEEDNEEFSLEKQVKSYNYYTNESIAVMSEGGYISMLRLYDTISGSATNINLNPSTTPYLTGCSGSLTSSDLLFPSGTTQTELDTWANNLQILIENAICVLYAGLPIFPTNNGTYFLSVEAFSDGTFQIKINNKNNPISPQYNIGINKTDANITFYDGSTSHNSNSSYSGYNDLTVNYTGDTMCGQLYINYNITESQLNSIINVNYNVIDFISGSLNIDIEDNGSDMNKICIIDGNLTGDTYTYGAYLDVNVYGGIPPYSFTGITQSQFFNSGDTYSFFVGDSGCNILHVTGEVICNEDLCLGNQVSTKTIQVTELQEIEVEVECPPIEIVHTMFLGGNGSEVGQITTYDYVLNFENFDVLSDPYYEIEINGESNVFNFTGNTESFSTSVSFAISSMSVSLTVYIRLFDGGCIYEQETEVFTLEYDLVEEDTSNDILLAPSYIDIIEQETTVNKIVYEIIPNTPVLTASYICGEDNTATLLLNASGGTIPYTYYGGANNQIIADGTNLVLYVEDVNGCQSNIIELTVDCGSETVDCNSINLNASLETTSLDNINETGTLTFTYTVNGLSFDEEVEEVNLVISGVGSTNNYILGSPIIKNFSGAFGAEQIYIDYSPNTLTTGTYKFIMVIKTENCTYTDIFEMAVDASILSDVDNYSNILT